MDESWVHTFEPGREPVTLGQAPIPKPKPQRFQSVRAANGRPKSRESTTPRRSSAYYGTQEDRYLSSKKLPGDINEIGSLGDLSLVDPHNRLRKLEQMLLNSRLQHNEEPEIVPETPSEVPEDPMLRTRPSVRDCNWEQFKNRYPDETETFAIEVLLAQDDLVEQIEADQLRRLKEDQRKAFEPTRRNSIRQPRGRKRVAAVDTPMDRVRINSAIVLGYLSKVTGEGPWLDKPHNFLAPFNLFVHYHSKMEEEFRALADEFSGVIQLKQNGRGTGTETPDVNGINITDTESLDFLGDNNSELASMMRSRKAYQDMKCYVDFVNNRIIPRRDMFSAADYNHPAKVRYRDLASLFRVGDLVIEPGVSQQPESRVSDKRSSRIYTRAPAPTPSKAQQATEPKLWRVCAISEDTPNWTVRNLDAPGTGGVVQGQQQNSLGRDGDEEAEATHLRLYYLDFDGQRFSPVRGDSSIPFFEGEKEISKLPIYPLRFHKDHERLLQDLQERGQRFRDIVSSGNPTFSHNGLTLTKDPVGRDISSLAAVNGGQAQAQSSWPESVESDVIVDFNEAFQMHPWWKPLFNNQFPPAESFYATAVRDEFLITEWSDRGRYREYAAHEEMVVEYDCVRDVEWAETLEKDPFLAQSGELGVGAAAGLLFGHLSQELSPDDLALLPARVFVYALRTRSFINADIRSLKPVPDTLNPLASLQLPEKHKVMIQSAVFGHLEKKKVRRRATLMNSEFLDQDIIRGKGRGLAVLLHGPPGVGKTATAEAVAHFYKKPLFPITSGDLGTDPWDVEAKLSEIFRLADLWDCILLLDEAETLLAQREKKDSNLQKSSLVSVFLRTLEYYSGILFLTTNRADVMDDAVKSRVQVSLQYPRLGLIETLAIFQTNLDRLMDIEFERSRITGEPALEVKSDGILAFAAAHYHRNEGSVNNPPWNGRQIRNAFQIAPSIARYGQQKTVTTSEGEGEQEQPYIGPEHFEKVEESTAESSEGSNNNNNNRYSQVLEGGHHLQSPSLAPSYSHSQSHNHSHNHGHAMSTSSTTSPNRQSTVFSPTSAPSAPLPLARRGMRSSVNGANRFSGEFHLRQRSSSSVVPLWLSSSSSASTSTPLQALQTQTLGQGEGKEKNGGSMTGIGGMNGGMTATTREPSPPWTPDLASVSDDADADADASNVI